jgi:glutaredoxin
MPNITILPARDCRRSRKIIAYLEQHGIPFTRIDLESAQGQALATQYDLRSSPGILVNGELINPFDLLIQPQCLVNEAAAAALFQGARTR